MNIKKFFKLFGELVYAIVFNKYFNYLILICVVLSIFNLLIPKIIDFPNYWDEILNKCDLIFIILFAFEFVVKFSKNKWHYFFVDYGWIDFLSSLPILTPALKSLRSIKLLRFTRVLRLLRFLKFTKETSSPLKQRFFAGVSSITLIVILGLGYILFNYQSLRLVQNEIKYLNLLKRTIETNQNLDEILKNEESILQIQKINEEKNYLEKIKKENLIFIKYYDSKIIEKYFSKEYIKNKEYILKILAVIKNKEISNYEKNDIDNLIKITVKNELNKIKLVELNNEVYDFLINKIYLKEIKEYYKKENKKIVGDFKILTELELSENEYIIFETSNNYAVIYSLKNLLKNINTFESFIISISFLTVVIIIICLNYFIQYILLNRIDKLAINMKKTIEDYQSQRNIIADTQELNLLQSKKEDDELTTILNIYNFLKNKLDQSFNTMKLNMNKINTLNTVYNYFQKTYDIRKHFYYIIISLTNKEFYKFDRAAIFLRNEKNNEFQCQYAIGANSRDELIKKFKDKNAYYKFNPSLAEAFELYLEHPFFNNSFEKEILNLSFKIDKNLEDLLNIFNKYGNVIKCPSEFISNEIVNNITKKVNSKSYLLCELKQSTINKTFGFIFIDNIISNENISNLRIQNVQLFINEILFILNNLLFTQYFNNKKIEKEINQKYQIEIENSNKIITEIIGV